MASHHAPDTACKGFGFLKGGNLRPSGLIYPDAIQNLGELVAILCAINLLRIRTQDLDPGLLQAQSNVLR